MKSRRFEKFSGHLVDVVRRPGHPNRPDARCRGLLRIYGRVYPCILGRSGITSFKREGDGATPRGKVAVELSKKYGAWVKPDSAFRRIAPRSVFQTLTKSDGWCDDSGHPSYNKYVQRPFPGSHEALLREDSLYDLIITLGWNTSPVIRHKGSAIFWHIAPSTERKSGKFGTEGCVSLEPKHFRQILEQMKVRGTPTHMRIL